MSRPSRSARCRVRASAVAIISLGGFTLGSVVPVAAATDTRSVLREVMSRLRPGGLSRDGQPPKFSPTSRVNSSSRREAAHPRHRQSTIARGRRPQPWEAAYNLAETDLREGRPAAARRRLEQLLASTPSRAEREFFTYKILLTDLFTGNPEPARRFLAAADRRGQRPPAYFYLHAALARHQGDDPAAERWLARAAQTERRIVPDLRRRYADVSADQSQSTTQTEDFRPVGLPTAALAMTPARVAVVELFPTPGPPAPGHDAVPAAPTPTPALRSLAVGGMASPPAIVQARLAEAGPPAGPTPVPEASRRPESTRSRKEPEQTASPPATAPTAPAVPAGKSLAEASPEVRDKFEAAQGLYTSRDYPGAFQLLNEIEAIQPNLSEVRNLRALLHYEVAYRQYIQQDYAGALRELDEADESQVVADTANLRGLVLARQRQYDRAEVAFRKAVAADPTLWAAKFNLADLPFGYRNYTEARQRFEALTAETDRVAQPRQAELTEFKVFLTLLLEGRESAARSFLSRFKPDGITPARLYAQAALDFHAGRFDRAIESVKDARKKYPPQLEAIFAESFYRVGWLTDGTIAPGTTVAAGTATPTAAGPEVASGPTSPAPEPTPIVVVAAAPTPVPLAAAPTPTEPAVVVAEATPSPVVTTPSPPEPPPVLAVAGASPQVSGLESTPAPSPEAAAETISPKNAATRSPSETLVRDVLPWGVLAYLLAPWLYAAHVILSRRRHRLRARRVVPIPRYPATDKVLGREKV